jgi:hypothetical protein
METDGRYVALTTATIAGISQYVFLRCEHMNGCDACERCVQRNIEEYAYVSRALHSALYLFLQ